MQNELSELNFCQQFAKERKWCIQNKLDVSKLVEENRYQAMNSRQRYKLYLKFNNWLKIVEEKKAKAEL